MNHVVDSVKQFDPETVEYGDIIPVTSLGSGLKVIKRERVNFSIALATEILETEPFGPDRTIDERWVNYLIDTMRNGTFQWEQVILSVCTFKGKLYRMNGQHTAWARINWDEAPMNLPVTKLRYSAQTEDDLRILYANIDRGKPRTKGDVYNSYLFESKEFPNFNKTVLRRIAEGLSYWLWSNDSSKHAGDETAYLLRTRYCGLALKVAHFLAKSLSGEWKHLSRRAVYAAMYATYNKHAALSDKFWEAVKVGANLDSQDPRLKLRNHLMTHSVHGGSSSKKVVQPAEMFGWCIQAWNAWRNEKSLRSFKSPKDHILPKPQ